jgi:hypothetical protein
VGQGSKRKRAFLSQHPICCFCGGNAPSTEEDHVPSRALFGGRQWPEGYSFPACSRCNRTTREDELVVALLARLYPDPETKAGAQELDRLARGVHSNVPQVLDELLRPSQADEDETVSPNLLKFDGPRVTRAVRRFGLKLGCALYYKHTGRIVPATSGVFVQLFTNLNFMRGEVPKSLREIAKGIPELTRNARPLDDQFTYRYGLTNDGAAAAFLAVFRESFALFCVVHPRPESLSPPPGMEALRPVPR